MSKRGRTLVVASVVVALMAALVPAHAEADWDDQSGKLGLGSGKTMVVIGAAAAGAVTLLLLKRKAAARKTQSVPDPAPENTPDEAKVPRDVMRGLRADPQFAGLFRNDSQSHVHEKRAATAE